MKTYITILGALLLTSPLAVGYTTPIENQTTEIIDNASWILPEAYLYVGGHTQGNSMIVTNAGYVESEAGHIGNFVGSSNNTVLITGSVWSNLYHLHVGSEGSFNTLQVSDGSTLYNQAAAIGASSGSTSNKALISGADSSWHCAGDLYIGLAGAKNSMIVSNGATVDNWFSRIGHEPGANENSVLVTGEGSSFTNQVILMIGNEGSDNHMTIADGGNVHSLLYGATIGNTVNSSNNSVVITDPGSRWYNEDNIYVGSRGSSNSISVLNGAYVEDHLGYLGEYPEATHNKAIISGTGSTWLNRMHSSIGVEGSFNEMMITNGGTMINLIGEIGMEESSSNNSVSVTGSNSRWLNYQLLYIGQRGSANTLTISDGGYVQSTYSGILGNSTNANNNSVLVTGNTSEWTINWGTLSIGHQGTDNSLSISNGATVVNQYANIGAETISRNNSIEVTGTGSVWRTFDRFNVGGSGSDNNLTIRDQATVYSTYSVIGDNPGSDRNRILVDHAELSTESNLIVGLDGSENSLTTSNGASVFNKYADIGVGSFSSNNVMLVTGTGSVWRTFDRFNVGGSGSDNTLTISNKAAVYSQRAVIGDNLGSERNRILVNDAQLTTEDDLLIGLDGSDNRLEISEGGIVVNNWFGAIGQNANSMNNSVLVSGTNSSWTCAELVATGGGGSSNSLEIINGGRVSAQIGSVGFYPSSSDNEVTVSGSESIWECGAALYVGGNDESPGGIDNSVTVSDGAAVLTDLLTVYPSNSFQVSPSGTLKVRNIAGDLFINGTLEQTRVVCDVDGNLTMGSSGKISMDKAMQAYEPGSVHMTISGMTHLDGTYELKAPESSVSWNFGTFKVFEYAGGTTGSFNNFILPWLPFGCLWDTSQLSITGELSIVPDSADINSNGIADGWEHQYFRGPASAAGNPDNDPFSNLEEFIAGTDPTSSASVFGFTNATSRGNTFIIEWSPCISNRLYSVNWSTNLTGSFQPLGSGIEYPQNSCTDSVHAVNGHCFYNVEVQLK